MHKNQCFSLSVVSYVRIIAVNLVLKLLVDHRKHLLFNRFPGLGEVGMFHNRNGPKLMETNVVCSWRLS